MDCLYLFRKRKKKKYEYVLIILEVWWNYFICRFILVNFCFMWLVNKLISMYK